MLKVPEINPVDYHVVMLRLLNFASVNGILFSYPTPGDIMDACENPDSIVKKTVGNTHIPDTQTGQMGLEKLFFKYGRLFAEGVKGFCCITQSVRDEKEEDMVEGRHYHMFPMYEVEIGGDKEALYEFVSTMLMDFGFPKPVRIKYEDACTELGVDIIGSAEETELYKRYGCSIALEDFPERSHPFFNMKRENGVAKKIDFLLYGVEVIGSAEREEDTEKMLEMFFKSNNGKYAHKLVSDFGLVPTMTSLFRFLKLVPKTAVRSGFGMGVPRFLDALAKLEESKRSSKTIEPNQGAITEPTF